MPYTFTWSLTFTLQIVPPCSGPYLTGPSEYKSGYPYVLTCGWDVPIEDTGQGLGGERRLRLHTVPPASFQPYSVSMVMARVPTTIAP